MPRGRPRKDQEEDFPVYGPFSTGPDGRKSLLTSTIIEDYFSKKTMQLGQICVSWLCRCDSFQGESGG